MLVKRYKVDDMQEAMDLILKELGPDAVILSSQKVRQKGIKGFFKKPILEVMVAYDPAKVPTTKNYRPTQTPYFSAPQKQNNNSQDTNGKITSKSSASAARAYAGNVQNSIQQSSQPEFEPVDFEEKTQNVSNLIENAKKEKERLGNELENSELQKLDDTISSLDQALNKFIDQFSYDELSSQVRHFV